MKKIIGIICMIIMLLSLAGCGNKTIFDATYTFDRAIIQMPNGEIVEGEVQTWNDYEDDDQIQVKIGGVIYLVHSSNVVLIAEQKGFTNVL